MSVSVNPPPMIRLPQSMRGDPEVASYYRHLDRMLLQLWKRSGGNEDFIADLQEDSEAVIDNSILSERIKQLEEAESQSTDLSVIGNRLNDLENDIAQQIIASGGSGMSIKSIQRGVDSAGVVTITAVDTTKTMCNLLTTIARSDRGGNTVIATSYSGTLELTSSTELTITGNVAVSWEVIEYN